MQADKASGYKTSEYVDEILLPQLTELVNRYKPDVLWSDGDWEATAGYWKSEEFLAWLYNDSPVSDTVVTNDRWGINCSCHHGGYFTCADRFDPGSVTDAGGGDLSTPQPDAPPAGHRLAHKWENCMTLDRHSWGFRRNAQVSKGGWAGGGRRLCSAHSRRRHAGDFLSIDEVLEKLVTTVACGGNLLLNVGPTGDGRIDSIFQERLLQLGAWMGTNGDAIYETTPWRVTNDSTSLWYTTPKADRTTVYAISLQWPTTGVLLLPSVTTASRHATADLLGYGPVTTKRMDRRGGTVVHLPSLYPPPLLPSGSAWVFRLQRVR